MATSSRLDLNWTIECTPNGPIEVPPWIFREGETHNIQPSSWTLERRVDVASSKLTIRFPDSVMFMSPWRLQNPLAPGGLVVLKVDGLRRFTGRVKEHNPKYSNREHVVEVVCTDRMGLMVDAVVDINMQRRTIRKSRFLMTQAAADEFAFEALDGATYLRPWKTSDAGQNNFIVPVWYQDITGKWFNIPFSEYDVYYDRGAIHFHSDLVQTIGGESFPLYNIKNGIYADFVYFDSTDDSTTISNILRAAFETPEAIGGLGWVEKGTISAIADAGGGLVEVTSSVASGASNMKTGKTIVIAGTTDYNGEYKITITGPNTFTIEATYTSSQTGTFTVDYLITDETPGDILSGMKWNTNLGDGDLQAFISMLYDKPEIALSPSYLIRDFDGTGLVEARLVLQDPTWPKDVNVVYDTGFPSPIHNIYTRIALVNTTGTRENLVRDTSQITDIFTSPVCPGGAWTVTGAMPDDSPSLGKGYLCDNTIHSSWGYFKHGNAHNFNEANGDIPHDIPFAQFDIRNLAGEAQKIDIVHVGQAWTFASEDYAGDQPSPLAPPAGNGPMRIYMVYQPMRFTVEYSTVDTPSTDDDWHPLHADLFHASVNDCLGSGRSDTHVIVKDIDTYGKHVRVICNTPFLAKTSNSDNDYRMLFCWLSEFQIFGGGFVLDPTTGEVPEVKFTDDPNDEYRCMYNLEDELVDLYRPTLLRITESIGLKFRSIILENDEVWDFTNKIGVSADAVSTGYKYLVTMLDSNSKENSWKVNIDYRPDIMVGSTVMCSRLNPGKSFLVLGDVLNNNSGRTTQSLDLSDYETPILGSMAGEGDGCD